jgi:hypothetical protein
MTILQRGPNIPTEGLEPLSNISRSKTAQSIFPPPKVILLSIILPIFLDPSLRL